MVGTPQRVAVIDDHPLFRSGLIDALVSSGQFQVVAEGKDASDAVRISREHAPDAILLDLNLPGSGLCAATRISEDASGVRVIIITVCETDEVVAQCMQAGASGYILKGISGEELVRIVGKVCDGDVYITPSLAARLLSNMRSPAELIARNPTDPLTVRELEVLRCVAEGRTNREIAARLKISEKTVKHYMTRIMQKLGVKSRVEAAISFRRRQA